MKLQFSKIVDKKKKTASMFITYMLGIRDEDTGRMIDGHEFAREMRYLDEYYDEIELHLNFDGGMVKHGLSVVSAMRDIDAKVITINDGVCASMAALILLNGDEVRVKDYSKTMLHEAYLVDAKGKPVAKPSAKQKDGVDVANDTLRRLLKKRGKSDEEAAAVVTKKDNWLTPEDLMAQGLIDIIETTDRKEELGALEPLELVAKLQSEFSNFNSNIDMNEVVAKLNTLGASLKDDATPVEIVAAINSYVKPAPVEAAKLTAKAIDALVAVGIKTGAIVAGDDGNEQTYRTLAAASPDVFVDLLNVNKLDAPASAPQARISDLVANAKKNLEKGGPSKTVEKDFAWYEKNDSAALAKIESTQPELFAKLQAADNAKYQ